MSGNAAARSCEDVDEAVLNYSEMQALATGDERIKEKIELDGDVARLRLLENEHYNAQYRLDDDELFEQALAEYNARQTQSSRRIPDYYEHLKKSSKGKPYYEIVVQFGDMESCGQGSGKWEEAKLMLDDYMRGFEKRNNSNTPLI